MLLARERAKVGTGKTSLVEARIETKTPSVGWPAASRTIAITSPSAVNDGDETESTLAFTFTSSGAVAGAENATSRDARVLFMIVVAELPSGAVATYAVSSSALTHTPDSSLAVLMPSRRSTIPNGFDGSHRAPASTCASPPPPPPSGVAPSAPDPVSEVAASAAPGPAPTGTGSLPTQAAAAEAVERAARATTNKGRDMDVSLTTHQRHTKSSFG